MKPNDPPILPRPSWPWHGWVGLGLIAVFWPLNWCAALGEERTTWGFFPLWLGYSLTVDALVAFRKGTSILTRDPAGYAALFLLSSPAWWLFELFNERAENWVYLGPDMFSDWVYVVFASLSFSTVVPAVFGTAELVGTFGWVRRMRRGAAIAPTPKVSFGMFVAGCAMLALFIAWPQFFFPFLWLSVYFLVEPVNVRLGRRSLLCWTAEGDWRPVVSLSLGCLICGFFWEMWNYYSYPKWTYQVPYVGFLKVFEMPLLGYGGYVPFAWELFALYNLIGGIFGKRKADRLVQIAPDPCPTLCDAESSTAAEPTPA